MLGLHKVLHPPFKRMHNFLQILHLPPTQLTHNAKIHCTSRHVVNYDGVR